MGKFEKLQICLWLGLELMAGQNMLNFVVKHLLEGCVTKTRGQWPHRRAGNMGHYCKQSTLIVPRERLSCKILTPIPLQPSISSRWSYPALEYLRYQVPVSIWPMQYVFSQNVPAPLLLLTLKPRQSDPQASGR